MARFFVPASLLKQSECILTGDNAAHAKVMRLRAGDNITLCDGEGHECTAQITAVSGGAYSLQLGETKESSSEPFCRASVYMAYAKSDKIDHVVQKATELGAAQIVLFPSERCVSRPDAKSLKNKLERWQRIALSAAEQSGRGYIPQVLTCESYEEALSRASQADTFFFFYENERQRSIGAILQDEKPRTLSLMSGPEGGFEPSEVEQAFAAGAHVCTLGPRILRCETAPLCALSVCMFALGEYD